MSEIATTFKMEIFDLPTSRLEVFRPDAIYIDSLPRFRAHELELRRDAGPLHADILDGFGATALKSGTKT